MTCGALVGNMKHNLRTESAVNRNELIVCGHFDIIFLYYIYLILYRENIEENMQGGRSHRDYK